MSLKEEVQELFNRQHALTSESCRRIDSCRRDGSIWNVDELQPERDEIATKLQSILTEGLKGDFVIEDLSIDKTYATVKITNGIFVIPCTVRYKQIGLTDFARKPGAKQVAQRIAELKECLSMQKLLESNRYVVGTSHLEAHEGSWVVFCHSIGIAA